MTKVFTGIAEAAGSVFSVLPHVGQFTNWIFGIVITIGTVYWLWYDAKVRGGGENYMAKKG